MPESSLFDVSEFRVSLRIHKKVSQFSLHSWMKMNLRLFKYHYCAGWDIEALDDYR